MANKLLMLVSITILVLIGVGTALFLTIENDPEPTDEEKSVERILSYMSPDYQNIDPCNDFYEYACGGFLENTELPKSAGKYSSFDPALEELQKVLESEFLKESDADSESVKKVKSFYQTCVDQDESMASSDLLSMKNLIKSLGGWPMAENIVYPGWTLAQWLEMFFKHTSEANSQPFFVATVQVDQSVVSKNMATADQPSLTLGSETYYQFSGNGTKNMDLKNAYVEYVAQLAYLYCEDTKNDENSLIVNCEKSELLDKAELVYYMENDLASLCVPISTRNSNDSLSFNPKTLKEFTADYPIMTGTIYNTTFNWMFPNETVDSDFMINDASEDFFKEFDPWFSGPADEPWKNESTAQNYLMFRTLHELIEGLPEPYKLAFDQFNLVKNGVSERSAREKTCVGLSDKCLTFPTGKVYVDAVFDDKVKEDVQVMMDAVLTTFGEKTLDEENDWMDDETKKEAHKKLDALIGFVGYPDYYTENVGKMDEDYLDFKIVKDSFFENYLQYRKFEYGKMVNRLDAVNDRSDWYHGPAIVNAWYDETKNTITIPAGILQDPFFGRGQSMAVNYGAIGMVLGHELLHGFDDKGRHYGPHGNKVDWWSEASKTNFEERAECLSNQYSRYYWDQADLNLQGEMENGENIADNGGLRTSYYAYLKWLSENGNVDKKLPGLEFLNEKQQVFLGYAQVWCAKYTDEEAVNRVKTDVHAPGPFRVLGPLANFEEFSEAFGCQLGDNYYPPNEIQERRCRVW